MIASLLKTIAKLLFRVEIHGFENIPTQNKLIIVANHESFLDILLLGLFLPKKATFVIHNMGLKSWTLRQALRLTPYTAVDSTNPFTIKNPRNC